MTILVAAVAARRSARPRAGSRAPSASAPSAPIASGLAAPLRGPRPPPAVDAGVAAAGPRMLHGGPRHTHRAAARGPKAPNVGWRTRVDGPVAAQVTVSPDESTLYVATLGGSLVALARADGAIRWSVALGDRAYATPLVADDGTVYAGTDAKRLFAISPEGRTLFRLETDGEADTAPAFASDGTFVFATGNHVYSARKGGDLAWRWAARKKVFAAPAVAEDGTVIVGSQDHHVHALSPTGSLAWTVDLGADVDGAPAIADDGSVYVGTDAGDVVKLDGAGHVLWRTPVGGFVRGCLSIARNGDVLAGTYGPAPRVVRVRPDGAVSGAFSVPGTGAREFGIHGGPLEDADGVLYFGAQDDAVYAVAPDGRERWRFMTGGDVDGPLSLLSDGSLVVPSEDGVVTLLLP
jgi:outer membrane protein assembly factor BamB